MPVYEYLCDCGSVFEKKRAYSEYELPAECPSCGGFSKRTYHELMTVNDSFGWRLTESSHMKGNPDEFERDI